MKTEAAVIPAGQYDWYTFNGARGVKIKTARGREAVLKKGSKFGVREGTKGKIRLITEELGATIVFTIEQKVSDSLTKRSTNNKKTPAGKKETKPTGAAPKPKVQAEYNWYTFNGARGVKIKGPRGAEEVIRKGTKFGLRAVRNGKVSLILEDSKTRFSLEQKVADSLTGRSTDNAKTPAGKADKPAAAPKRVRTTGRGKSAKLRELANKAKLTPAQAKKRADEKVVELKEDAKKINAVMPEGQKVGVSRYMFRGLPQAGIFVRGKSEKVQNLSIHLGVKGDTFSVSQCPQGFGGSKFETWPDKAWQKKPLTTGNLSRVLKKYKFM